jgi:methylase of polypeptide subunit release factors
MPAADIAASASGDGAKAFTVSAARRALTEQFRAAGLDTPELDARILVGCALSLDRAALAAAGTRVLDVGERKAIAAFADRRLKREPVARIVGSKEFWSVKLRVDSNTLVPRPETETVVEAALAAVDAGGSRTPSASARTRASARCASRETTLNVCSLREQLSSPATWVRRWLGALI